MNGPWPAPSPWAADAAEILLGHLFRASLAGGAFAVAVWLLARSCPRLPAGARSALWWAASLKLLLVLVWPVPLELPLLPAPAALEVAAAAPGPVPGEAAPPASSPEAAPSSAAGTGLAVPEPAPGPSGPPWRAAVAVLWLAGVCLGAVGLARELAGARRLRRHGRPVTDPELLDRFEALRRRLRVRPTVALRLYDRIPGPLTTGWLRPAVLLPPGALDELDREELDLALGHELLHVRRRDLWAAWVPRLARWLFFFHPLAALAAREHVLAREAACDAAVLRELGAAPRDYGRLLLRWAPRATASPPPEGLGCAAGASPSFIHLKRRLEMLTRSETDPRRLRPALWTLAIVTLAALTPVRITAHAPAPPAPPAVPAAPEAPTPPAPPAAGPTAQASATPAPPAVAAAPRAPEPPEAPGSHSWFWSGDGESWALLDGDAHVWIHASSTDSERVRTLQDRFDDPVLWFTRDGREYVIRDSATLDRARAILEPQRELGRRQGELGRQQGELGRRQGELGREQGAMGRDQGELGSRQGELGAEQATIAAERAALEARRAAGEDAGEELESRRSELESRMRELAARQRELGERQKALGTQQRELSEPQRALAERQRELAERQRELARAQQEAAEQARTQMRSLLDESLAQGVAEPFDDRR